MWILHCNWIYTAFSLIFLGISEVQGDCGFPAIPNRALAQESLWNSSGNQTFEEGSQMIFSCQSNFFDILQTTRTKICSKDGAWTGEGIQCSETMHRDSYSVVVNSSKVYGNKDPAILTEVYNREFGGHMQLVLPTIRRVDFMKMHVKSTEHRSFSNKSNNELLDVHIGRKYESDCLLENQSMLSDSEVQSIYICFSFVTKDVNITFRQPYKIIDIVLYLAPENKCNGRPEIPLNALAEMVKPATVLYQCQTGFFLKGKKTRSCDPESGLWLPDAPSCEQGDTSSSAKLPSVGLYIVTLIGMVTTIGLGFF